MVDETTFVVRIPQTMYDEMVAHVIAGYPNEACGALGCKDGQVVKHYPTDNAAEAARRLLHHRERHGSYLNDIEEYNGEMIYYHSHPISEAYPSRRDKDWAKRSRNLYIIFSHQYYPEPPYARVFKIDRNDLVTEGKIELV